MDYANTSSPGSSSDGVGSSSERQLRKLMRRDIAGDQIVMPQIGGMRRRLPIAAFWFNQSR